MLQNRERTASAVPVAPRVDRWLAGDPWHEFALVSATIVGVLLALAARTQLLTYSNPGFKLPYDHHKYIYMAQHNPFDFHLAPFCWRPVTPLLAKLLPFSLETNFFLVTFVSVALTALCLYFIAKAQKLPPSIAYLGVLLFLGLGIMTKGLLSNFWLTDPLSVFCIMLAVYFAMTQRAIPFLLTVVVGVGVREGVLLVAPLYYTLNARRLIDLPRAVQTLAVGLPGVATFFAIRKLIPSYNHNLHYLSTLPRSDRAVWQAGNKPQTSFDYKEILTSGFQYFHGHFVHWLPQISQSVRAMILIVPFLLLCSNLSLIVRFAPFILLLYLQVFFIADYRYTLGVYPIVVVLALFGAARLISVLRTPPQALYGLPLLFVGMGLLWKSRWDAPLVVELALLVLYLGGVVLFALRSSIHSTSLHASR